VIEPLIGKMPVRVDGRGRPWKDARKVPKECSGDCALGRSGRTCRGDIRSIRRAVGAFQHWSHDGTFEKVGRYFSWAFNFRRLVVRWEHHVIIVAAFVPLRRS
jgi:hypothetical protein